MAKKRAGRGLTRHPADRQVPRCQCAGGGGDGGASHCPPPERWGWPPKARSRASTNSRQPQAPAAEPARPPSWTARAARSPRSTHATARSWTSRTSRPYIAKAIVDIEDARFYKHGAVDLKGMLRAVNRNAQSGQVSQGASTLTQQYVKNVFVEEAGNDPDKVAAGHPADHRPQDQGTEVRDPGRGGAGQEADPGELPQHHLLRPAGLRRRGRLPALLQQAAKDLSLEEAALLAGHRPVADPVRPGQRPTGSDQAAQHRAGADGRPTTSPRRRPPRPEEAAQALRQQAQERLHHRHQGRRLLLRLRTRDLPERPQPSARPGRCARSAGTRAA